MGHSLMLSTALLISTIITWSSCSAASSSPNIVFIVADDLGWNDVGFQNPDIISPNIDRLAKEGIILDQSYVQPVCTPSRGAWMTGVYPFRLGLQHGALLPQQAICAPLNRTFLPEQLKTKGYKTHMVGKWHLGYCKWECTPTYRGFDSFYGYLNGQVDYYNKTLLAGYDFRDNKTVCKDVVGDYSTYQYTERAKEIISAHDPNSPLFLYLPYQNVHTPLQVPQKYYNMYPHIKDQNRRIYSGMVTALDDAIGDIVTALKTKGLLENTLIAFTADNGGWTINGGNNYPLRGGKITIFEGGTRAVSFVNGPMFKKTGIRHGNLMHAVDWFPTLIEAAGIESSYADIDGVSQWQNMLNLSLPSPRKEVVYNLDFSPLPFQGRAAIRVGDYKLIDGFPGLYREWYKPAGQNIQTHKLHHTVNDSESMMQEFNEQYVEGIYEYLFNLKDDPNERKNLYHDNPGLVKQLKDRLEYHVKRMVDPGDQNPDPKANPKNWGGNWSPGWC